jgi:hypothetical protein
VLGIDATSSASTDVNPAARDNLITLTLGHAVDIEVAPHFEEMGVISEGTRAFTRAASPIITVRSGALAPVEVEDKAATDRYR